MTFLWGNCELLQFHLVRVHCVFISKLNRQFLIVTVEATSGQSLFSSLCHYPWLCLVNFCWYYHLSCLLQLFSFTLLYTFPCLLLNFGASAQAWRKSQLCLRELGHVERWPRIFSHDYKWESKRRLSWTRTGKETASQFLKGVVPLLRERGRGFSAKITQSYDAKISL